MCLNVTAVPDNIVEAFQEVIENVFRVTIASPGRVTSEVQLGIAVIRDATSKHITVDPAISLLLYCLP